MVLSRASDARKFLAGKKGGLAAPLFCLGLAAAVLASREPPLLLLAAAAALVVAAGCVRLPRGALGTATGVAVVAFGAVVLGSVWLWGTRYSPVAVYQMALLVGAYLVGRACAQGGQGRTAIIVIGLVAVLASAWALWQFARLGYARADAWFETPNLLAAFVNLALVPIAVLTLLRGPRVPALVALALLWAGLMTTQSRGGWLGLAGGGAVATLMLAGSGWRAPARTLAAIVLSLAAGYGLVKVSLPLIASTTGASIDAVHRADAAAVSPQERASSSESRIELYALAVGGARARPLLGSGYLSYGRLFERDRARVPSYEPGTTTLFVHDDYLQILLELGLVGLLPFLVITAWPALLAYRRRSSFQPASPRDALGIAAVAGLATMATHALVDFPFYVPGTLAGYGLLLGVADDWLHPQAQVAAQVSRRSSGLGRVLRLALFALGAYAFAVPAAAETCSLLARDRVRHGNIAAAVYWLQVARNFDPRDWRRHWQLAELLAQQAALLRDPKLAQLAADAYETGMRADPGDVHNLLGWLTLQCTFGARLAHPASRAQLLARMSEASALAPLDTAVRVERMLMLRYLGEPAAAQVVAQGLLQDFPDDPAVRRLVDSGARG